ncbi:hypothetical protein [Ohtaekwangia koreensis]|uniref:Uncharacterized protein n=1 Tax=Ohtaekwangia koreensis TaxID=688867 RepID=A0A1T5LCB4_9BACT|nr:hypothetical protein [Ohtaekwangia koreensis]SKC73600.1 hypothetical protein SAMN05660236_2952 [Ohtaekwangia koreensis]
MSLGEDKSTDAVFDKKSFHLVVLILFCLLTSYYLKSTFKPIEVNKLSTIKGALEKVPYWGATGGDFTYEYVEIIIADGNYIHLSSCSYETSDLNKIRLLQIGDSITFQTSDSIPKEKEYEVFTITSKEYGNILTVQDYNACEKNRWKMVYYIALASAAILILRIGIRTFDKYIGDKTA